MTTLLLAGDSTQGCRGTPLATPGLGGRSVGQPLLVSVILWGSHGWTGILHLPGVQSFSPRGEEGSCPCRSFPAAQGQAMGGQMFPILVLGGNCCAPVPVKSIRHPQLHHGCVCSELTLLTLAVPPALHRGGQQGCRQEPFADREDFLHEWTNQWLILLARGLGSKCGGLRSCCCCCGCWRQEDASRAGLSQSPQLLAEKPKITMFEGSESEVFPFPGLFTVTFACAGVGRQLLLLPPSSPWEAEGPREGRDLSLSLLSFHLQASSCHGHPPAPSPAALFLSCPLWAPSLAPALLAPLLMAPSRMFDASRVLCLELCLCCL